MKLEDKVRTIEFVTLDDVMHEYRYNKTKVAEVIGVNRGTLRKYLNGSVEVLLVKDDDGYKAFVHGRENGAHKKDGK